MDVEFTWNVRGRAIERFIERKFEFLQVITYTIRRLVDLAFKHQVGSATQGANSAGNSQGIQGRGSVSSLEHGDTVIPCLAITTSDEQGKVLGRGCEGFHAPREAEALSTAGPG